MQKSAILFFVLVFCFFFLFTRCSKVQMIGGQVDHNHIMDGIYDGSYKSGPVKAEVKVTINDHKISNIELVKHRTMKGKKAEAIIPDRIIEEQSTRVDAVTGATKSSCVIMNAVQDAILKAQK